MREFEIVVESESGADSALGLYERLALEDELAPLLSVRSGAPAPGTLGEPVTLILAGLATAAGAGVFARVFTTWLKTRVSRTAVTFPSPGGAATFTASGDGHVTIEQEGIATPEELTDQVLRILDRLTESAAAQARHPEDTPGLDGTEDTASDTGAPGDR